MADLQVAERLDQVREQITAACARAGRPEGSVRLVAVSKRIALPLVVAAFEAGQRDFGENRVLDVLNRQPELSAALSGRGHDPSLIAWHFIGHIQSNKSAKVAGRFSLLHGVDSLELAERISRRCLALNCTQPILLEVNIAQEVQKSGLAPALVGDVAAQVAALPGLALTGLMGMARRGDSPQQLGRTFAQLRLLAEAARQASGLPLPELSMGMSNDFPIAIAEGATTVRVGSAIFGPRSA